MAGVSRSGYYAWLASESARNLRDAKDREDFDLILEAYKERGYAKGAQSIHMNLLHRKPPVLMNVKKIRRLMDKFNLSCPVRKANPYRRMAQALKTSHVADNLLHRQFEDYGPRMVLLTDITYLPYNDTFAYLSTILDAFTKQILSYNAFNTVLPRAKLPLSTFQRGGRYARRLLFVPAPTYRSGGHLLPSYSLSDSLEVDFVLETVQKLISVHGISLHAETIVHSDQGCHYTSHKFQDLLFDKNLRQSMSRRGNC